MCMERPLTAAEVLLLERPTWQLKSGKQGIGHEAVRAAGRCLAIMHAVTLQLQEASCPTSVIRFAMATECNVIDNVACFVLFSPLSICLRSSTLLLVFSILGSIMG